ARSRRFRARVPATVPLAGLRAGRRALDALAEQLRRPAPALDLRAAARLGRALLAREPDPHPRTAALSGRRGPADGRRREPRPEPATRAQGDGPLRLAARGARAPELGRGVRGRGLSVLRRPRRRPVAPRWKARGRRRPGGLEEPVPRALRAAARLPARAA